MTPFWIAAIATTVAVLGFLLLPLTRKPKGEAAPARADFDLTVYKDQLTEVSRDLERGVLSDDQALAARTEIERRMLAVAGEVEAPVKVTTRNTRLTGALMGLLLVAIPLGAFGLYYSLGNPGMGDRPLAGRVAEQSAPVNSAEREAKLNIMSTDIKARVDKEPNNPRNWSILGRAYEMQGDQKSAIAAYQKLVVTSNRHPEALIVLAEAMFGEAGQVVTPDTLALFREARAQDPSNPMTYYYIALGHQQEDDLQGAIDEYLGLLSVSPSNGPWVPDIQGRITALSRELGIEVPVAKMLPPQDMTPAPESAAPGGLGPSADQVQQAKEMSPEEQQTMIRSMVARLAAKLKDNPDDLAGWKRLAQAYKVLGDAGGVADAEAQIKRLSGQ